MSTLDGTDTIAIGDLTGVADLGLITCSGGIATDVFDGSAQAVASTSSGMSATSCSRPARSRP